MALSPVTNFAKVQVSLGYTSVAVSIVLTAGQGAKLPATFPYPVVWWDSTTYDDPADDPNVEIVSVTNRVTDTLTVTRAQEGTSASNKNTASKTYKMALSFTAALYTNLVTRNESWLGAQLMENLAFTATVAASALTIAVKTLAATDPTSSDTVRIGFRNSSNTNGTPVIRTITSALSLVISNGSAMGATATLGCRLYILALDNAGTVALGLYNPLSGTGLLAINETGLVSTTAEGGAGAADSAQVIYSTAALTGVAARVIGYVEVTPAAAFAWTNAPTKIVVLPVGAARTGSLLQRVRSATSAFASGTTVFTTAATNPSSSYGDQYMTVGTTFTSTMNLVRLKSQATWSGLAAINIGSGFLPTGSTAQVGCVIQSDPAAAQCVTVGQEWILSGTTTTGIAFRGGPVTAGTLTFNGINGGAVWGNAQVGSYLEAIEEMV